MRCVHRERNARIAQTPGRSQRHRAHPYLFVPSGHQEWLLGTPKTVRVGSAGLPSERAKISVPSGPNVRFPPGCADPRNLAQNPWMATDGHLAEFPKDAFNIAVHVRTGEAAWSELTLPIPAFTWVVGDRRPKPGPWGDPAADGAHPPSSPEWNPGRQTGREKAGAW